MTGGAGSSLNSITFFRIENYVDREIFNVIQKVDISEDNIILLKCHFPFNNKCTSWDGMRRRLYHQFNISFARQQYNEIDISYGLRESSS